MNTKELYEKINAILDEYNQSPLIASEAAQLVSDDVKPGLVICVLLETMRIRRLREQAAREKKLAERDSDDADLLERLLLD